MYKKFKVLLHIMFCILCFAFEATYFAETWKILNIQYSNYSFQIIWEERNIGTLIRREKKFTGETW